MVKVPSKRQQRRGMQDKIGALDIEAIAASTIHQAAAYEMLTGSNNVLGSRLNFSSAIDCQNVRVSLSTKTGEARRLFF
jgi:hypothetical protein